MLYGHEGCSEQLISGVKGTEVGVYFYLGAEETSTQCTARITQRMT